MGEMKGKMSKNGIEARKSAVTLPPSFQSCFWHSQAQMRYFFACLKVDTVNLIGVHLIKSIAPRWIILRKENSGGVIFCPQEVAA